MYRILTKEGLNFEVFSAYLSDLNESSSHFHSLINFHRSFMNYFHLFHLYFAILFVNQFFQLQEIYF